MISHSSLPKSGTARKIWEVLENSGYSVIELHYTPCCYGRKTDSGYGTWACEIIAPEDDQSAEYWCGIIGRRAVYLQNYTAPYTTLLIGFTSNKCPFYYTNPNRCKYPSMCSIQPPDTCIGNCKNMSKEMMIEMCNLFEKVKQ